MTIAPFTKALIRKVSAWDKSYQAASTMEPELLKALAAWFAALAGVSQSQMEAAILAGDVGLITAAIWSAAATNEGIEDIDARLLGEVTSVVSDMIEAAGMSQWASLGIGAGFTLDNPYSLAWIPDHCGSLVSGISDRTRAAIAEVVAQGFADGLPPRTMAREIRAMIGLLSPQSQSVLDYAAELAAEGRSASQVASLVARRRSSLVRDRALLIARTETVNAHAEGALESWQVARTRGFLPPGVRRVWIAATASDRTCPICRSLDGLTVDLDGQFSAQYRLTATSAPKGITVRAPTAHPACRCAMGLDYSGVR